MKLLYSLIVLFLALPSMATATDYVLDSNTAFFEGEVNNYVVPAPRGFRMVTDEAMEDGHSMAFIPLDEVYAEASVVIAVTMLKLGKGSIEDVILSDTSAAREYFGDKMVCWLVDSLRAFNGEALRAIYFDNKSEFLPLVMMSYFNGGADVVVFELDIADGLLPRFQATEIYTKCISLFRVLKKATPADADTKKDDESI